MRSKDARIAELQAESGDRRDRLHSGGSMGFGTPDGASSVGQSPSVNGGIVNEENFWKIGELQNQVRPPSDARMHRGLTSNSPSEGQDVRALHALSAQRRVLCGACMH